jgi:hypothetical protein
MAIGGHRVRRVRKWRGGVPSFDGGQKFDVVQRRGLSALSIDLWNTVTPYFFIVLELFRLLLSFYRLGDLLCWSTPVASRVTFPPPLIGGRM